MNKKFLSAILFGALLVASTGTFVSCKDYDDDIDGLQGQIDKIASSLSDLQGKVGTCVKSVTYDPATGKLTVVNGENSVVYTIAQNLPNYTISVGKDGTVSLLKDGQVVSSGTITFPAGAVAFDPSKLAVDSATGKVLYDGVETKVIMPTDGILSIEDTKNADGVVIGYTIRYKDQAVTFALNDALTLKGLVFKSDLFVDGIEAIEYPYLNYTYLKGATPAKKEWNDDQGIISKVTEDQKEWFYTGDQETQFNPIEYINYHLNPSSAKVAKEDLSFVSRDVEMISSRASVTTPKVADMKAADEGILPVGFTAIGKMIAQEGEGSIMALQAIVKANSGAQADTTITSDYALLYASKVTPEAIAFNDNTIEAQDCSVTAAANPDELFKEVQYAIEHAPSLKVAYNSSLDLTKLLATHYNQKGEPNKLKSDGDHKVWAYGDEAKFGLKYDYKFIQYTSGNNVTSDSKYVDATTIADGVVTPRIVNSAGETLSEQGLSSVGKRPLVRVRITDTEGRVVLHGFIKIEIVKQIKDIVTDEFNKGLQKFGCDRADVKLTWSEISYQLLEKAAVSSKADFDALYKFDNEGKVDGTGNQYVKDGDRFVKATSNQLIGYVEEKVDQTGTTNTVLHWNLEKTEQQDIYEMADHKATIYVRYISKAGTTHAPIYMPLTVAIAKPQGTVTKKIAEYWYGENKNNTRLNVAYPKDNGSAAYHNYTIDLNQVWEGNLPKFTTDKTAGFASYTDAIFATQYGGYTGGYKYYFAADQNKLTVDGVEYTLTVKATTAPSINGGSYAATTENMLKYALSVNAGVFTNEYLYANTVKIATINQQTGYITYENNSTSKALLNAFGHNEAAHFANIGVTAYSPCGIAMSLDNPEYPAYFLRPIDPIGVTTGEFIDAQANGSTLDIAKLFNFQDWRNVKFEGANAWLYAYYELSNVKVNLDKVTTTLNGGTLGTTLLSTITNKIELTQTNNTGVTVTSSNLNLASYNNEAAGATTYAEVVKQMGKIKYVNNGNNVQDFQLRIPVEFTYYWGTINTYVDVAVKGTMGN